MGKIEIDVLNGRNVVFINRQGIRIAPTYKELKEIIALLIELYGEDEVYREIGVSQAQKGDYYKGIKIIWDEDHDIRIFEGLDVLEKQSPTFFNSIDQAGETKGQLLIHLKYSIGIPPESITVGCDFWPIQIIDQVLRSYVL